MKSGIAFHCHHDILYEFVYNYDMRVKYIKEHKPLEEQELRLKLFKLIPDDKVPGGDSPEYEALNKTREALDKAWEAFGKAWEAYFKAREAWDKAWEALDKAWEAFGKAWEALDKAREAWGKAWEALDVAQDTYFKKYDGEIKKLHEELCPDCPWGGRTIFRSDQGG